MPIDPRLAASGNPIAVQPVAPVQSANPLGMIQTIGAIEDVRAQVEQRRAAAEAARQAANDRAALQQAATEAGGDPQKLLTRLYQINPTAAAGFEQKYREAQKEQALGVKADLETKGLQISTVRQFIQASTPQNYPVLRAAAVGVSKDADQWLPKEYDADALKALEQMGLTAEQRNQAGQKVMEAYLKGDYHGAASRAYGHLDPAAPDFQAQWDQTTADLQPWIPPTVLDQFKPTGSPTEAVAHAQQLGISPEKRAELAGQQATRTETGRHNVATEAATSAAQAQTAANQAATRAIAQGQLDVARGHLAVAQAAEKRQEQAKTEAGGIKLSPTQQEDISTMLTVQQLGQEALQLGEANQWVGVGPVEGRIGSTPVGYGGEKGEALRNKLGNIQGTIAKLRGGTSFTPNEQKLLESYTPTITDTDTKIKTKLKTLNEFIENKRASTLRVASGQYTLPDSGTSPPPSTSAATGGAGLTYQDYQRAKGGR